MGKKYIIEIPDDKIGDFIGSTHFLMPYMMAGHIGHHDTGLPIKPYIEHDLEQIRKEAYEEGRKVGIKDGMYEAWKAARFIADMPYDEEEKAFGSGGWAFIVKHTASEAIEKIKAWEDGKQEIRVGDEVSYYGVADEHGNVCYSGVVLEIREGDYLVMEKDGKTYALKKKLVMSKTGRHFPEIAAVLEKMRENK